MGAPAAGRLAPPGDLKDEMRYNEGVSSKRIGQRLWSRALLGLVLLVFAGGFEWEGRLARLTRDLDHPEPERRIEVVRMLGTYPARSVRAPLSRALGDDDPRVRAEAVDAVARAGLREAGPLLVEWLGSADDDLRERAARALGALGWSEAAPALVRALGDASGSVRRAATGALGALGGDEVVVPLLGRLDDPDPLVRMEAARVLGRLRDERAVPPLIGRARDDDPAVRGVVFSALGELSDPRSLAALIQGVGDETPDARLAAIAALGALGRPEASAPLAAILSDEDARAARAAAAALGRVPGRDAVDALVSVLPRGAARAMALSALEARARRGGDGDAEELVNSLAHGLSVAPDHAAATQLVAALDRLGEIVDIGGATPALLEALRDGRGDSADVVAALGRTGAPEALLPMLERLQTSHRPSRLAALDALVRYFDRVPPDGRAADPLLAALGDASRSERLIMVRLLGRIGARRAHPDLERLLDHPDAALRSAAIEALGGLGDEAAAARLLPLLDDPSASIRLEAGRALGRTADRATLGALMDRVEGRAPNDRHAAMLALELALRSRQQALSLESETANRAEALLHRFIEGPSEVLAARAIVVLEAWAPPGGGARLATRLDEAQPSLAPGLVRALAAFDEDAARAALRASLSDVRTPVATNAAAALGEHGGAEEATALLAALPEARWPISGAMSFSLARLARRGVLGQDAIVTLCEVASSRRDAHLRANLAVTLAALDAPPCPDGPSPLDWLALDQPGVVRAAAARWATAAREAGHLPPREVRAALATCAESPLEEIAARACRAPSSPALDATAVVTAHAHDASGPAAQRLIALRLADGSVYIAFTDRLGRVRVDRAPRGPLRLEDPTAIPLAP